jgi:hypothetical protein
VNHRLAFSATHIPDMLKAITSKMKPKDPMIFSAIDKPAKSAV